MPRALDHIVWPARDLDALADVFRRLGFTVGRRNRHPWGTENHIVQFDGVFLELLGLASDFVLPRKDEPAFPFAGFCERYLAAHAAGAAMLVLQSQDAQAEAEALRAEGLGAGRLLPFSRGAQGPDGRDRTVAFTIAFADLPGLPEIGAFLCQHHRPENFWNAAAQLHDNGVSRVTALTIRGPDPRQHAPVLRRFAQGTPTGVSEDVDLSNGCRIVLDQGPRGTPAAITSLAFRVSDLGALAAALAAGNFQPEVSGGSFVVRHPALGETALVFRPMAA